MSLSATQYFYIIIIIYTIIIIYIHMYEKCKENKFFTFNFMVAPHDIFSEMKMKNILQKIMIKIHSHIT